MPTKLSQNSILVLSSLLLLFAPIVRGGKTSTALMSMELVGLLILLIIFWNGSPRGKVSQPVWWFIIASLTAIAAYLIPLPDFIWSQLPGRLTYVETVRWIEQNSDITVYKSLALVPLHTVSFLLTCIPSLAIFLAVSSLSENRRLWLVYAFLCTATLQAMLGMIQHFTLDPAWHFGVLSLAPQGTYLNQNHLTAFMEMAEPIALALMIYAIIHPRLGAISKTLLAILFATISLLLTFIPLIASSRMGVVLLLLSVILSFWVMTTPGIRKRVAAPIFVLRVVLLALAVVVQLQVIRSVSNVVAKMEPQKITGDLRWELWGNAWEAIQAFWPWGTGASTLQQAYRSVESMDANYFTNHLHNDYLQLIFELGAVGILIIIGAITLYIWQWIQIRKSDEGLTKLLQAGAGVGILLLMLYSLTEFNLHTPANVVFSAFLFGIFLMKPTISTNTPLVSNLQKP